LSANVVIPSEHGITPVDPDFRPAERAQQDREREADCPELLHYIKSTCDAIQRKDADLWERIINEAVRCMAYYDNRQYGIARGGVFQDAKWNPADIRPLDNRYLVQIKKLLAEMLRSKTRIEISASNKNDQLKVEAAKFAQYRVDEVRKRTLKNSEREREYQSLLLKAITYRYIYPNPKPRHGTKIRRPKKETRKYGSNRSLLACKVCSLPMKPIGNPATDTRVMDQNGERAATATEAQGVEQQYQCAKCGSTRYDTIQLTARSVDVVTGYEEEVGPQVESQHIDPLMVRIDLDARRGVVDSQFLWYHQLISRCILEDAYPHAKIKSSSGTNPADQYKRDLQSAPSNSPAPVLLNEAETNEPQGGDQLEKCPLELIWLDPVMYRRRKFKTPQRLLGGRVLPANVELGTLFPDGMCVAKNDDQILDMTPEDKNRRWLFCVYGIREHALHGTGTSNLLGPQDTRNELKAYLIANMMFNAAPREFIRDGAITGNKLPALHQVAIIKGVPKTSQLEGFGYQKVTGTPLPDQAMQLYESEGGALQEGAGTSSLSQQGADADIRALSTATAVAAMRDMTVGRMGPDLMLVAEMEEEWTYLVMEHELDHFSEDQYLRLANQATNAGNTEGSVTFSSDGIRAFMKCNPRCDFTVLAVEDSWMPRSETERKANVTAFTQAAALIAKNFPDMPALAQRFIAMAADAFDVDVEITEWNPTALVAMARIRAFARTVEIMRKHGLTQPTEQNIADAILYTPDAAIDNDMDNHLLFRKFYEDWWPSDEGRSCPPLLRAIIKAQSLLHRAGLVYEAQQKATDELAANEPRERKAAEIAAAAAQANAGKENKQPSVSMSYKDAPEDIRRQIEADADYTPSQMGAGTGEAEAATGEAVKEATKIEGQMALQQQKAELQAQGEEHKTQLKIQEKAAEAQIEEQRAEGDHSRALELAEKKQDHDAGIQGAKMVHESAEKDKDRQTQREKPKSK
jgi:hypothetical protein